MDFFPFFIGTNHGSQRVKNVRGLISAALNPPDKLEPEGSQRDALGWAKGLGQASEKSHPGWARCASRPGLALPTLRQQQAL
jgi:hypothetical protein